MLSAPLFDETVKKDFGYLRTVLVMLRRGECLSAGDFAIAFGVFGHSKISCIVLFSAFGNSLKGGGVFALYAPA